MMRKQVVFPHQAFLERLLRKTAEFQAKTPVPKAIPRVKTSNEIKDDFAVKFEEYFATLNLFDGPLFRPNLWEGMPGELNVIIYMHYQVIRDEAELTKSHPYNVSRRAHILHRQMAITELLVELKPAMDKNDVLRLEAYIGKLPKGTIRDGLQRILHIHRECKPSIESIFKQLALTHKYDGALDIIRMHYEKALGEDNA